MSEPSVVVSIERRAYQPGETLNGEYRIEGVHPSQIKRVEVSVLWHTEGKGEEDLAVHEFSRHGPHAIADGAAPDRPVIRAISSRLPSCPLSYDGQIVKLRWCVRVRVFLPRGKSLLGQRNFRLGNVPPAPVPPLSAALAALGSYPVSGKPAPREKPVAAANSEISTARPSDHRAHAAADAEEATASDAPRETAQRLEDTATRAPQGEGEASAGAKRPAVD